MADTPKKPEDPSAEDKKNLKKLLDAHLHVLEHKLGRPPQMEELLGELAEGVEASKANQGATQAGGETMQASATPTVEEEHEPKILHYKVYYGMKLGKSPTGEQTRVPDPKRALFFESKDGRCYDTKQHSWCPERPEILDHLQSRPLMFDEQGHDIMSALLHGVMDDQDYQDLDKADLLNEHHKKIYALNKQLQSQVSGLEKSENSNDHEESEETSEDEAAESPAEQSKELASGTETNNSSPKSSDDGNGGEEPYTAPAMPTDEGTADADVINVVEEIMKACLAEVGDKMADMDGRIRAIVKEEINRIVYGAGDSGGEPEEEEGEEFGTLEEEPKQA